MTTDYSGEPRLEGPAVSKIELTRNAKGDPQWRIVVAEGATAELMNGLRSLAVKQHLELVRELM